MMRRRSFLHCLTAAPFALTVRSAHASPVVRGCGSDVFTGEPVGGNSVEPFDSDGLMIAKAKTDPEGSYSLGSIPDGSYTVVENTNDPFRYQWKRPVRVVGDKLVHIIPDVWNRDYNRVVDSVDFQSIPCYNEKHGFGVYLDDQDDLINHFKATTSKMQIFTAGDYGVKGPDCLWDWLPSAYPVPVLVYTGDYAPERVDHEATKQALRNVISEINGILGFQRYNDPVEVHDLIHLHTPPFLYVMGKPESYSWGVPIPGVTPEGKIVASINSRDEDYATVEGSSDLFRHEFCHDMFIGPHSERASDVFNNAGPCFNLLEKELMRLCNRLEPLTMKPEILPPPMVTAVNDWFVY